MKNKNQIEKNKNNSSNLNKERIKPTIDVEQIGNFSSKIKQTFLGYGFELDDLQVNQFDLYMLLLQSYNKVINLIASSSKENILYRHFLDSVFPLKFIPKICETSKVLDIGTGAGFPGLPIAILTKSKLTGIDGTKKRILFLKDVINTINAYSSSIKNIEFLHTRAEEYKKTASFTYDFVFTRAVSSLSKILELSNPFITKNGIIVCLKSQNISKIEQEEGKKIALKLGLSLEYKHYKDALEINRILVLARRVKDIGKK